MDIICFFSAFTVSSLTSEINLPAFSCRIKLNAHIYTWQASSDFKYSLDFLTLNSCTSMHISWWCCFSSMPVCNSVKTKKICRLCCMSSFDLNEFETRALRLEVNFWVGISRKETPLTAPKIDAGTRAERDRPINLKLAFLKYTMRQTLPRRRTERLCVSALACVRVCACADCRQGGMGGDLVDWSAFDIQPCLVFICLLAV